MDHIITLLERCRMFAPGDDDAFRQIIIATVTTCALFQRELAAFLKVAPPTISRWMSGQQIPQARVQAAFVRTIVRRLKRISKATQIKSAA